MVNFKNSKNKQRFNILSKNRVIAFTMVRNRYGLWNRIEDQIEKNQRKILYELEETLGVSIFLLSSTQLYKKKSVPHMGISVQGDQVTGLYIKGNKMSNINFSIETFKSLRLLDLSRNELA